MKLIVFCKGCRERIGKEKIAFLETLTIFHGIFNMPSFLGVNDTPGSVHAQKLAGELEEMGYIVTHEDQEGDLALFPKDISPKVRGCHLFCKHREEDDETHEN